VRYRATSFLAVLIAVPTLAAGVASANRFSINSSGFRTVFRPLTFTAAGGEVSMSCNFTFEGSFHSRVVVKTVGLLVGHITRASLNECRGGGMTVLAETLPWHLTYARFAGTLPTIDHIYGEVIGASLRGQPTGLPACLARTTTTNAMEALIDRDPSGGRVNTLSAGPSEIPMSGEFGCIIAGEVSLSGTATVTQLGSTAAVTVNLI
jgi:hypothetical protein